MSIEGQQRIEQCEICGEPAEGAQRIVTPHREADKTGKGYEAPVKAWLCARHAERMEADEGWQERERKARLEQRKKLREATEAATLFDPGPKRQRRD